MPRGQAGGTGIAVGQMLNDMLAPVTGARYDTVDAGGAGGREFQIHDPWNGRTVWVPERELLADRMAPMFPQYARLTHVYPATSLA